MLGSIADAEDAVHDAFVKWLTIDTSKIENTKAYLIRIVTNTCLNILQQKDRNQELIEEVIEDEEKKHSFFHFDLNNQLTEAWKQLHARLRPIERKVYVLREVFDIDYEDLQHLVDRKADNCRQILSRAKSKLKQTGNLKVNLALPEKSQINSFLNSFRDGQLTQLLHDLSFEIFTKKK